MHKNGRTNLEVLHYCLVFGGVTLPHRSSEGKAECVSPHCGVRHCNSRRYCARTAAMVPPELYRRNLVEISRFLVLGSDSETRDLQPCALERRCEEVATMNAILLR